MFEPQKKHRVNEDVKELLPQEVITGIFDRVKAMRKEGVIIAPVIAFAFSDDYEDDKIYILSLQNSGALTQEYELPYSGKKDFLGHGTIIIVKDQPKTIRMSISELNQEKADK